MSSGCSGLWTEPASIRFKLSLGSSLALLFKSEANYIQVKDAAHKIALI